MEKLRRRFWGSMMSRYWPGDEMKLFVGRHFQEHRHDVGREPLLLLDTARQAGDQRPPAAAGGSRETSTVTSSLAACAWQGGSATVTSRLPGTCASEDLTVEVREIRPPVPEIFVKPALSHRAAGAAHARHHGGVPEDAGQRIFSISCRASIWTSCCRRTGGAAFPLPARRATASYSSYVRRVSSGAFTQQLFDGTLENRCFVSKGRSDNSGSVANRRDRPCSSVAARVTRHCARCCIACSKSAIAGSCISIGARRQLTISTKTRICGAVRETSQPSLHSRAFAPRAEEQWQGRTGWVHAVALEDHPDLTKLDVYASGLARDGRDHPPRVHAPRPAARAIVLRFVRLRVRRAGQTAAARSCHRRIFSAQQVGERRVQFGITKREARAQRLGRHDPLSFQQQL